MAPILKTRKHGTFLFLLPDESGNGRLAAELRSMKRCPLMVIRSDPPSYCQIIVQGSKPIPTEPFKHLSIPANFNIHFTDRAGKRRLFFEAINFSKSISHLFSFVSRAVNYYREPKGVWRDGSMVLIFRVDYHPNLSLVLDFYVHTPSVTPQTVFTQGETVPDASYSGILGAFAMPVKSTSSHSNAFCTIRYGSCHNVCPNIETFIIPRAIRGGSVKGT